MNPARLHAACSASHGVATLMICLILGAHSAIAGVPGLGDLGRALRKAHDTAHSVTQRVDETKARADQVVDDVHRVVVAPVQQVAAEISSAESLKAGIDSAIAGIRREGGSLSDVRPVLMPGDGAAATDTPDRGDDLSAITTQGDLATLESAWQQALDQAAIGNLCERVARRNRESQQAYRSRANAQMAAARKAVAALVSDAPLLAVSVGGRAIQLGTYARAAASSKSGVLNFTVTLEDLADAAGLHLFDPDNGSLADFVATGPADGDNRVRLHGTLECTAAACARLRASRQLTAKVVLRRTLFDRENEVEPTACARVGDCGLVPVGLQVLEAGRSVGKVTPSFREIR